MSDEHATDTSPTETPEQPVTSAHEAADDHGGDHGHDDHGHGAEEEALGPVDTFAWGAGLLGVLAGLLVVAAFVLATVGVRLPV